MFDAYLFDHCRTPIWLARTVLQALQRRHDFDAPLVGDVARIAVPGAGWALSVAGVSATAST